MGGSLQTNKLKIGLFFIGLIAHSSLSFAGEIVPAGRVVSIKGRVYADARLLRHGDSVFQGETIKTETNSSLKLLMDDRSIVDLGPSTHFKLSRCALNDMTDREVELGLELGRVRTSVTKKVKENGRFLIRTPASVLAVRGTEFVVACEELHGRVFVQLSVIEGAVAQSHPDGGAEALVLAGNRIGYVPSSGRKEPKTEGNEIARLSGAELKTTAESRIPDDTFQTALAEGGSHSVAIALASVETQLPVPALPDDSTRPPDMYIPGGSSSGGDLVTPPGSSGGLPGGAAGGPLSKNPIVKVKIE